VPVPFRTWPLRPQALVLAFAVACGGVSAPAAAGTAPTAERPLLFVSGNVVFWDTGGRGVGTVFSSRAGDPETPLGTGPAGAARAPWIGDDPGVFRLYAPARPHLLATARTGRGADERRRTAVLLVTGSVLAWNVGTGSPAEMAIRDAFGNEIVARWPFVVVQTPGLAETRAHYRLYCLADDEQTVLTLSAPTDRRLTRRLLRSDACDPPVSPHAVNVLLRASPFALLALLVVGIGRHAVVSRRAA
jgi:hypothetical protein